jgi:hypothetical protein
LFVIFKKINKKIIQWINKKTIKKIILIGIVHKNFKKDLINKKERLKRWQ